MTLSPLSAFQPTSLDFIANPYPVYAALRDLGPIHYHPEINLWLVPRHADVTALLRDRRFGRTYLHLATHAEMGRPDEPPEHAPFWHVIRNGMLDREPPDHTRLRSLVSKAFTPQRVENLRGKIEQVAGTIFDADGAPHPNGAIELHDGDGELVVRIEADANGNFYTTEALPLPDVSLFPTALSSDGKRQRSMPWPTSSAACNVCHVGRQVIQLLEG